jgi:hypothetical protein
MNKLFAVSRQISVNGNPPTKITYRHLVPAETAEKACAAISGDWSISITYFNGYPQDLTPADTVRFIGDYSAEEVQND